LEPLAVYPGEEPEVAQVDAEDWGGLSLQFASDAKDRAVSPKYDYHVGGLSDVPQGVNQFRLARESGGFTFQQNIRMVFAEHGQKFLEPAASFWFARVHDDSDCPGNA
jgi:hypothetical protein